jgi:hypothetical protein
VAALEEPFDQRAGSGKDHAERGLEELGFGGFLDLGEFGVSSEMSFVGGLSDGFAGEGLSDGDALGNECGDAFDEWNGNFGFGSGFRICGMIHPAYHMGGKSRGVQQLHLTPFDTLHPDIHTKAYAKGF